MCACLCAREHNIHTLHITDTSVILPSFLLHSHDIHTKVLFQYFPDNVHTGINFVDKVESCAMVRFVRVTYVQPMDTENTPSTYYTPPRGFSYKTFVPAAIKVGMCSGAPEYEPMSQTWERAKAWLKVVGMFSSLYVCLLLV